MSSPNTEPIETGTPDQKPDSFPKASTIISVLLIGIYFGIVLTKSEVVRWQRVHDMFLLNEPFMYLIIGTGVAIAGVSMFLMKKLQAKSIDGNPIVYDPKPFQTGVVLGGMVFGGGWAITGARPDPIYAQIGGGAWMALFTLAGAMCGMFLYAWLKPRLPHQGNSEYQNQPSPLKSQSKSNSKKEKNTTGVPVEGLQASRFAMGHIAGRRSRPNRLWLRKTVRPIFANVNTQRMLRFVMERTRNSMLPPAKLLPPKMTMPATVCLILHRPQRNRRL